MINKLAKNKQFRELVRAVFAYIEDAQEWEKEVECLVKKIIPASDIKMFRDRILKANPWARSLSDYFSYAGPKNEQSLKEMIKSKYWGLVDPNRPLGKPIKTPGQTAPEFLGVKPQTEEEKQEFRKLFEEMEQWRRQRPPVPRSASIKVVNKFLSNLGDLI